MNKHLILCCDDAGVNLDNDLIMTNLALENRISAISIIIDGINAKYWRDFPLTSKICTLGLHFNLTWKQGFPSQGLKNIIFKSYTYSFNHQELLAKIHQQLQLFEELIGRAPDFIDGHQHVHMLPQIRKLLLTALKERYGKNIPPIRAPISQKWRGYKASILNNLGASALYNTLLSLNIPCNHDFAGVYDFSISKPYAERMQLWLENIEDDILIMSHPGALNEIEHYPARIKEAEFLFSEEWTQMLLNHQLKLVPFSATQLMKI